jgi:hypothetical protein
LGVLDRQQAKSVPRWRKPWKQGKYYVEQYKYGKFVSALQEYAVDTLKQLVALLLRPPHRTSPLWLLFLCS